MKTYALSLLLTLLAFCVSGQEKLTLNRQQMRADFDSLSSTLRRVSPHIRLKKALWRYDALAEIQKLRGQIDTVQSDFSYFLLLNKVINLAQDGHTSIWGEQSDWVNRQQVRCRNIRNSFKLSFGNVYNAGHYQVTDPFVVEGDTIEIGSEITHINGQKVSDYLRNHLSAREGCSYDLELGQFYSPGFFKNLESIFQDSIGFTFLKTNGKPVTRKMPTQSFTKFLPSKNFKDSSRVELWTDERTLYIRLMQMDESVKPGLFTSILGYKDKVKDVDRVVIDIRGNPGGNDNVWQDLFSRLIDKPIRYGLQIDALGDISSRKIIGDQFSGSKDWKKEGSALLKGYGFYRVVDKQEEILPDSLSVHFGGKIVVLAERHYSSAGSMVAVAGSSPMNNLFAVGRGTGYFMGIGFAPGVFKLPHTGLQYRIAPSIEVSRAKNLSDLMHYKMSVSVSYDMNYFREKFRYTGSPYSREFMIRFDPMIRAALVN